MIDKNLIGISSEEKNISTPKTIVFLVIVNEFYPNVPPYVLTKTNFSKPSLMDGRDLLKEICPNWTINTPLSNVINEIIPFLAKVINTNVIKFYGEYHLGYIFNLENFDKMIVSK